MTRQWRDPRVDFAGEFWQMVDAAMEPKSFQKPCPRLWFGGGGRTALRRAVLRPGPFAGLFGAGQVSTVKFADQVQIVRQALAEAGRPKGDFAIAKRVYIAVDDDAHRLVAEVIPEFGLSRVSTSLSRNRPRGHIFEFPGRGLHQLRRPAGRCRRTRPDPTVIRRDLSIREGRK
jgi:alkanesulfonate monooxygenase SsuD/methylene tetrahydromethanopterin reductase-like flavin-dependent oxidoreductase (luciferase family)